MTLKKLYCNRIKNYISLEEKQNVDDMVQIFEAGKEDSLYYVNSSLIKLRKNLIHIVHKELVQKPLVLPAMRTLALRHP